MSGESFLDEREKVADNKDAADANFVLSLAKTSALPINDFDTARVIGENLGLQQASNSEDNCSELETSSVATSTNPFVNLSAEDNSALNAGELHQALMAVMHRKDELQEKNKSMRSLLDQEMEQNAELRKEAEQLRSKLTESKDNYEVLVKESEKESEVLRNQLKKYVGAVQALKKDNAEVEAQQNDGPQNHVLDVSEAEMYEKKLIEVTNMHAELMEFNERMTKKFKLSMNLMRSMKAELVDLRGPMPSDDVMLRLENDELSDQSASSKQVSRALINIWMPSMYLIGKGPDAHHVYQVYVRIGEEEWNVYRRYSHFHELHIRLRKKFPVVDTFNFPPKRVMGNKGKRFVEDRRKQLQMYLRLLMNGLIQHHEKLFKSPDKQTLIALLPFFSETSGLNKETPQIGKQKRR